MQLGRAFLLALLVACSPEPPIKGPELPPKSEAPRYEEIWGIATHNSYWVDRGNPDALASGTSERMLDQLLGDGARGVEIDIHKDPANPHHFLVYHTNPGNSLCDSLADCLGILRAYHDALPAHAPTLVVLELKEIADSNFDASHTFEDLDAELRAGLGPKLYSPKDLLTRCIGLGVVTSDLATCVDRARWPDIDALRGRFVVGMIGNWDVIATTTADWASYANSGIVDRAAFPMASTWKLDYQSLPELDQSKMSVDDLARAKRQSVLAQVEDPSDPLLSDFLKHGAVVRIDGATTVDDQALRVGLGAQLLQTDTPWISYRDGGIAQPLRSYRADVPTSLLEEPGERLGLAGVDDQHLVFAGRGRPNDSVTRWEATLVAGHDGSRVGCLRAESTGTPRSSVTVCRHRHDAPMALDNQVLDYQLSVCDAGSCSLTTLSPSSQLFSERVAIDVTSAATGESCVGVSVASSIALGPTAMEDSTIAYEPLGGSACVNAPLARQGIARMGATEGSALFFRARLTEDSAAARGIAPEDFDIVDSEILDPKNAVSDTPVPDHLQGFNR